MYIMNYITIHCNYRNWCASLRSKLTNLKRLELRSKHYLDERHTSAMFDHFMFGHHMFPETAECEALFGSAFAED